MSEGKSQKTVKNVRDTLRLIINSSNLLTIEDINSPRLLKDALKKIANERNWKASTFNTCRKNLNTYFLWLEAYEYIEESKIKKVRKDKETAKNRYTLSEKQVQLINSAVYHRDQNVLVRWRNVLFFHLLSVTGARPVELLNLTLDNIKKVGSGYKILIDGAKQNQSIRPYVLSSTGCSIFEMYMKVRKDLGREEDFLFVSATKRGKPWTYSGLKKICEYLTKECGFTVQAYAFRRYVATVLFTDGHPIIEIMHHLGHTNTRTTTKYIDDLVKNQNTAKAMGSKLDKFTGDYDFT